MLLRKYHTKDLPKIAELFYDTVHSVNSKDYTAKQLDAWASADVEYSMWDKSFQEHYTIVAYKNKILVGFGDISNSGYLDRLFVHSQFQSQGIATAICDMLEEYIFSRHIHKITTLSSITAKAFFEKRNYRTIHEQTVERQCILLKNYFMEK